MIVFSILQKLFGLLIALFCISLMSFGLIRMIPGDPVTNLLGERGGSPEIVADLQRRLNLDRPLSVQYWTFLTNAARGDLGTSIQSRRPVLEEFRARFAATAELAFFALAIAVGLGIPLGIFAAVYRNTPVDYTLMSSAVLGYSMPIFWWGLMLILLFSVYLGWTPVSGRLALQYDVVQHTGIMMIDVWKSEDAWPAFISALRHMILPAIVLATVPLASLARMTRASLLEVLGEDYIRTARSFALPRWRIIFVHAFRNALTPIVTLLGLLAGSLVTGAVLTEAIFSWPGLGQWMLASVLQRDYPVIQGGLLLIASLIMIINLFVDLTLSILNPRLRGQHARTR